MMSEKQIQANWRIKIAFVMFIISLGWVVIVPVLPILGFSAATIATFSGMMVVLAEILMVAGAAIAGKDGFAYIKSRVFGLLKVYGPPQTVGRTRYTIGLILFVLSVLSGWVWPYAAHFIAGLDQYELALGIAGDLMLLTSLFVLGGDFWDKLRSLFIYSARAMLPEKGPSSDSPQ